MILLDSVSTYTLNIHCCDRSSVVSVSECQDPFFIRFGLFDMGRFDSLSSLFISVKVHPSLVF